MKTRREFLKKTALGGISGILVYGSAPSYAARILKKEGLSIEKAAEVHKKVLTIDGHNDTPVERVARGENPLKWKNRDLTYNVDIPRMKEGGYNAGFFIVGDGPTSNLWVTTERTIEQAETYPEDLTIVLSSKDIVKAKEKGKIGIILSIEGIGRWLDGNPDTLGIIHRLGVRHAGITHGEGGSEKTFLQGTPSLYRMCTMQEREDDRKNGGGLSPFGMDVLKMSNSLGMVTDLSHINDKAFYDVLEHSALPPIMSHTAVYSLCNHARCMTDDQIKALAAAGGVMGVAFAPMFIDPDVTKATIDRVVEHICYAGDLVGMDYVGIGTDYDGLGSETVSVVPDVSKLPLVTKSMLEHGMSEEEIKKVWGGNFLRVLKKTIDK